MAAAVAQQAEISTDAADGGPASTKHAVKKDNNGQANGGGAARTLDGAEAEDEFVSDAINYQILQGKIDAMLDRLKLDA